MIVFPKWLWDPTFTPTLEEWYSHVLGRRINVWIGTEQVVWDLARSKTKPPERREDECQQTCHGCRTKPREMYAIRAIAGSGIWVLCPDCVSRVEDALEYPHRHPRCPMCLLPFNSWEVGGGRTQWECPFGHQITHEEEKVE